MPKDRAVTISILVERIVNTEGKKGQAVAKLGELHAKLKGELDEAIDQAEQKRLEHDLQYLEGYQQTPAALIADMQARPLHRRHTKIAVPA